VLFGNTSNTVFKLLKVNILNTNYMNSRIIAISNQKGGVGKTTSSLNLAAALALEGNRVLLIDLDPQANLSKSCGIVDPEKHVYGVLLKEYAIKETVAKIRKNLLLIPASKNLAAFEQNSGTNPDAFYILQEELWELTKSVDIDFIIIDCPPSLGLLSVNAYVAASEVYTPCDSSEFSLDGLEEVIKTISKMRKRLNPDLQLAGVFFTRHHKRKLISQEVERVIQKDYPGLLLKTSIRECVQLKESPSARKDVFDYSPICHGAEDYRNLANEILNIHNHVEK
jgi:chromosome partitioning protein